MNQCWYQCKRGHRKRSRREDIDVNGAAKCFATQLQEKKIKLSHSVHRLSKSSAVNVNNETIHIDLQLLFQRLIAAGTWNDQLEEFLQLEICSYPPAIFEARYDIVMMPTNKPAHAYAIWVLMPKYVWPTGQSQYVLDGGFLVHRIPWQRGTTYNDICRLYTNHVTRIYGHTIIVFDGYQEELSTKYGAHERRTGGRAGPAAGYGHQV